MLRRGFLAAAVAATLLFSAASFARAEEEYGGKIDWVREPAVGFAKARVENRAAMLFFSATW
jgi:hypothetical protein